MTVGIDLSDSQVRAVAVSADGVVSARFDRPGSATDLAQTVRAARKALKGTVGADARIGVATLQPGDELTDEIRALLSEGAPVMLSAGAACALAESWCGAAVGARDIATLRIGRHVTAGAMVDGKLLRGAHGAAASVAWLAVNPVERDDYRRFGGLESEVSAAGIVRRFVWRVKAGDRSAVEAQVGGDLARVTIEDVLSGARANDGVCVSVVRDTIKYVGLAVANLATILDPECIVLGGTLVSAGPMVLDGVRQECRRRLQPAHAERLHIVLSSLGEDAAALGAARAALLQHP